MKAAGLAIALLFLAASAQARTIKADIDAADAKFVAAFNTGDAGGIAQLYTENANALPPGAPMAKGRAAIEAVWQSAIQAGVKNLSLKALQVDQFGNAAREIGQFSLDEPNAQKQTVHVEGKYVVLWRRIGGGWKLDTDIWNTNQ
jgi:ketosteroid isomerase-like protein